MGDGRGHADSYVSSALKGNAAGPLESTLYFVPRKASGVSVLGEFDGLGLRGNGSSPVRLEKLPVAKQALLSRDGEGAAQMLEIALPWFSLGTAAMANGLCLAAIAETADHLASAGFDGGVKLRDLPNLRARLAEMSVRTESSRALLGWTARLMESPTPEVPLYVLRARSAALDTALEVTDLAMKACGGAAFSKHLGLERLFRDARAGWVMSPTVDHLNDFIGRAMTGLPLF